MCCFSSSLLWHYGTGFYGHDSPSCGSDEEYDREAKIVKKFSRERDPSGIDPEGCLLRLQPSV
jgi:hypothetical protein